MKRIIVPIILASAFCGFVPRAAAQEHSEGHAPAKVAIDRNNAGVTFMQKDLFKEAALAFREALTADPSFNLARINLGIALFYDQDLDGALQILSEAATGEPRNPYIIFTGALACKNKEEREKAIERFTRVTELDPKCSASYYNLGILYARQGREKEAETALRRVLELDPAHTGALYNLGGLLVKTGRAEEGKRLLETFRQHQESSVPKSGMGSGTGYGEMGKYAIAQEFRGQATQPPNSKE
jgi:Flp pilus assembly protein TadD